MTLARLKTKLQFLAAELTALAADLDEKLALETEVRALTSERDELKAIVKKQKQRKPRKKGNPATRAALHMIRNNHLGK